MKLELLSSIAKSQLALARILDSVASISEFSAGTAQRIGENIVVLTAMQEAMAETVTGLSIRHNRKRLGQPVNPWLNSELCLTVK